MREKQSCIFPWTHLAVGSSRESPCFRGVVPKDDVCILECAHSSITLGLLEDGPADLWALQRRPRPSRCHSPAATSSILLTLGRRPERAISQTSPHCISGAEETSDSRDAADILIARNFKRLGVTAEWINNYDCLSFPHCVPFRF